jgi:hypothetical protein
LTRLSHNISWVENTSHSHLDPPQVYKVDEAITTKWDWKKGILPVLSDTKKSPKSYDQIATAPEESPEVFA